MNEFSTFLKMPQNGKVNGIVKDNDGNPFILMTETLTKLNDEGQPYQEDRARIKKLNNIGTKLVGEYIFPDGCTGRGLTIDNNGDIYACGYTTSICPGVNEKSAQSTRSSMGPTGFIIKLKGQSFDIKPEIMYATYLGSRARLLPLPSVDFVNAIAVDQNGNAWVTGATLNSFIISDFLQRELLIKINEFPITNDAYQNKPGGFVDAFITKINSDGTRFLYSTYLGGKSIDMGNAIAIDNNNNVYVTGSADAIYGEAKIQEQFKVTKGVFQEKFGGGNKGDAFVIKLDNRGSVNYCSYLGGSGDDNGIAIGCDDAGNAYIVGTTTGDFEITKNAYQKVFYADEQTIFIAKISPNGTNLDYASYFGGCNNNLPTALKIDELNNIFMVGKTNSSSFQTTAGAFKPTLSGPEDGFLSKFNITDNKLIYSTFIGGSKNDNVATLTLGDFPFVYIAGETNSEDFPTFPDGVYGEDYISKTNDGFTMKFSTENAPLVGNKVANKALKGMNTQEELGYLANEFQILTSLTTLICSAVNGQIQPVTPVAFLKDPKIESFVSELLSLRFPENLPLTKNT